MRSMERGSPHCIYTATILTGKFLVMADVKETVETCGVQTTAAKIKVLLLGSGFLQHEV